MPSKLWGSWCSRANMTDGCVDYNFHTQPNLPPPGWLETQQIEEKLCPWGGISLLKNPQNFEGFVFQLAGRIWYISICKVTDGRWSASNQQLFQSQLWSCLEWFTALYTDECSVPVKRHIFFRIHILGMLAEQVCYLALAYVSSICKYQLHISMCTSQKL